MICRYVQWRLANLEGAPCTARVRAHLEGCTACQGFHQSLVELEFSLRASGLNAARPAEARRKTRPLVPVLLLSGVAALALLVWLPGWQPESSEPAARTSQVMGQDAGPPTERVENSQEPLPEQGLPVPSEVRTLALLLDGVRPLEDELAAWRRDGQRGLDAMLSLGRR